MLASVKLDTPLNIVSTKLPSELMVPSISLAEPILQSNYLVIVSPNIPSICPENLQSLNAVNFKPLLDVMYSVVSLPLSSIFQLVTYISFPDAQQIFSLINQAVQLLMKKIQSLIQLLQLLNSPTQLPAHKLFRNNPRRLSPYPFRLPFAP